MVASYFVRLLGAVALLCSLVPVTAAAQASPHPRWEIPGFDFRKDGVWRAKARAVRAMRSQLLAGAQFSVLNSRSAMGTNSATTVSGVLKVPAILFRYKDSPAPLFAAADYDAALFAAVPSGGRPYTYRSFYQQLSNGLLDIQGTTYTYTPLDSNEVWYAGGTSTTCAQQNPFGSQNCNGLFSNTAVTRMQSGLREALTKLDATVDFSQYVTSAADNGFVPLVLFIPQAMGGECGPGGAPENHLWAHRFTIGTFQTNDNDPFNAAQKVKISDYILQSGLGGSNSCTTSQIMPIGTVAHETGHGFGLPDLYDTDGTTEGVGQWDLISSGSFTTGFSPARFGAWSLNELGWITIRALTTTGTYTFDDGSAAGDTAFYVRVQGPNPRGEYYLLENRQRQQSDTALIRVHCQRAGSPAGCPGGLLIWHIDSAKIAQSVFNDVNTGPIHGVALVQADSFGNLDAAPVTGNFCPSTSIVFGCSNRGDAGDLFPGTTNNTRGLLFRTNPAARKNEDGSFAGFAVDSVQQLVANRTLSFRLRFGALTVVRASDTTATVQVETASGPVAVFREILEEGRGYQVHYADPQFADAGRRRLRFASWSDGGAITHTYIGKVAGDTLIANIARDFKLIATSSSGGTIQADTSGVDITSALAAGAFIPEGRSVTLTATPTPPETFGGWSGDTVTTNATIVLPMGRPFTIFASFGALAISSAAARPNGVMGASYNDTLRVTGGTGGTSWSVTGGALPSGVTLDGPSGVVSGFPRQTGNFTYTASVTSGAQTQAKTFTFSVSAPTLATNNVLAQLFGGSALTADQQRYLDFLGNNNAGFDIGDFLAWVKLTGAPLSPATVQTLQNLPRRKGGSQ
jgi:M6 family metalloprotease-like protein